MNKSARYGPSNLHIFAAALLIAGLLWLSVELNLLEMNGYWISIALIAISLVLLMIHGHKKLKGI